MNRNAACSTSSRRCATEVDLDEVQDHFQLLGKFEASLGNMNLVTKPNKTKREKADLLLVREAAFVFRGITDFPGNLKKMQIPGHPMTRDSNSVI